MGKEIVVVGIALKNKLHPIDGYLISVEVEEDTKKDLIIEKAIEKLSKHPDLNDCVIGETQIVKRTKV